MTLGQMLRLGGEVAAVVILSQVEGSMAGEYCHGHANENNLRYQAGFYCPVSIYLYLCPNITRFLKLNDATVTLEI